MWPHKHSTACVHIHNPVGEQIVDFLDPVSKLLFAGRREQEGHGLSKIKDTLHFTLHVSLVPRSCQRFGNKSKQKLTFGVPESSGRQPDNELPNERFLDL